MLRSPIVWLQYYRPNTSDTGTGKTSLGFGSFMWMFSSPTTTTDGRDSRLDGTPLPGPQTLPPLLGSAKIMGVIFHVRQPRGQSVG